jgi:hypothetical protein
MVVWILLFVRRWKQTGCFDFYMKLLAVMLNECLLSQGHCSLPRRKSVETGGQPGVGGLGE